MVPTHPGNPGKSASHFSGMEISEISKMFDLKEMSCKFIGSKFLRFGDDCDIIINQRKLLHHDKL